MPWCSRTCCPYQFPPVTVKTNSQDAVDCWLFPLSDKQKNAPCHLPQDSTGCICVPEWLCCVFAPCFAIRQHPPAAFRRAAWLDSLSRETRFHCNYRIVCYCSLWKTSDLLTSGQASHILTACLLSWVKYDVVSTQCFVLKLTGCFNVVSVFDFPSC